jgi:diaminopropionate ammonia-lyase
LVTDAVQRRSARVIGTGPSRVPQSFHASLDGYAETPLVEQPRLAAQLGLRRLWCKDESLRLGLPSFKILGASWAVRVALVERLHLDPNEVRSLADLRARLAGIRETFALVAATDGNHGRAIANVARQLGLPARVFVPSDMVEARRQAIADEGAEVIVVDGGYDDAVRLSAEDGDRGNVVVSDTSWPGYETTPRAVIDGYSTIFWEVDDALRRAGSADPDVVFVPVGVGALAAAAVRHYRRPGLSHQPVLVALEPRNASCLMASVRAGSIVTLDTRQDSIMSGLNCGTPSVVAWPECSAGFDLYVEIDDDSAREGMRLLAAVGIQAGECAGGAVGGARDVLASSWWRRLELPAGAVGLILLTEGVTDPAAYAEIVSSARVSAGA